METDEMKITFNKFKCIIILDKYQPTNQNHMKLIDEADGLPVAIASTNIPDQYQASDEIFIKSWSENNGVRKALIDAEIIGPVIGYVPVGWVMASRHKLLI